MEELTTLRRQYPAFAITRSPLGGRWHALATWTMRRESDCEAATASELRAAMDAALAARSDDPDVPEWVYRT